MFLEINIIRILNFSEIIYYLHQVLSFRQKSLCQKSLRQKQFVKNHFVENVISSKISSSKMTLCQKSLRQKHHFVKSITSLKNMTEYLSVSQ